MQQQFPLADIIVCWVLAEAAAVSVALVAFADAMPWAEALHRNHQTENPFQSRMYDGFWSRVLGTVMFSSIGIWLPAVLIGNKSESEWYASTWAFVAGAPVVAEFKGWLDDVSSKWRRQRKDPDSPWAKPLNFRIYLINASVNLLSCAAGVTIFWWAYGLLN